MYIVLKWSLSSNENSFILQILQIKMNFKNYTCSQLKCPVLEECWLRLSVGAEVPGLHHHVGEGGGGEGDGEVQLAIEGGHPAS